MKFLRFVKKIMEFTKNYIFRFFIFSDFLKFRKAIGGKRFSIKWKDFYPQIRDKTRTTNFDRHYLYHTAWAARKIKEINPKFHIDIASSLYFCSLVSAFVSVKFYDYRPPDLELSNLEVHRGDLTKLLFADNSVYSISCMHTIEHIGLGRYGESIDPDGDLKAIKELKRVLVSDGSLLFVVPIGGESKIMFNAHRIYSYDQIVDYFKDFELKEFSLITEFAKNSLGIIINATKKQAEKESYGCGCFWFIKRSKV
ncbi:MAG: DUF268 domain-containing protein [Patescibacteria group bacterium]|nr:DUF268 domain-containing protein [Patescibacteria group bacterium]